MKKIKIDILWNYLSFGFLAFSGIFLNIIIGTIYNEEILGLFNQVTAIYIIFSMLGSAGINFSVLRSIASSDKEDISENIIAAIILSFIISAITIIILYLTANPISQIFESPLIKKGIFVLIPGVFFFSINKVFLGIINGLREMKSYAILNILRYLFISLSLLILSLFYINGAYLPSIFSISEFVLFILLLIKIIPLIKTFDISKILSWIKIHFTYGIKCFTSGIMVELNTKVDILLIGYFLSDKEVGIYSFAAFFAEGFYQLIATLQNIYNPIIANESSNLKIQQLEDKIKTNKFNIYLVFSIIGFISIYLFSIFINNIEILNKFRESIQIFRILILGIVLSSGYIPFFNLLSMSNKPAWHNLFMTCFVSSNILMNFILIPIYGINGAAVATTISLVFSTILIKIFSRRIVKIKI